MRWKQIAVVVSLAVTALLFANGCLIDWLIEDSAGRRITELYTPYVIKCEDHDGDLELQVYNINADGSLSPAQSRLNGEDCDESEPDTVRGSTMSPTLIASSSTGSSSVEGREAAGERTAFQDWYGAFSPIPGVPSFPDTTPTVTPDCTPGTSFYMVNHLSSTVSRIETCPLRAARRINVGSNPLQLALTPDAGTLVVTRYDSRVVFIDTATDTVTDSVSTLGLFPNGIAISPDGATAYITNFNDSNAQVFEMDLATHQIGRKVLTQGFPKSVFLTPDGQQLWVNYYGSSTISIIDTLTMTIATQIDPGGQADTGLAFNATGTRAYIAVISGSLAVYDTATLQRIASIPTATWPGDVVITPDGSRVYVGSWIAPVTTVIDTRTNQVISSSPTGPGGMGMMFFH